MKKWVKIAVVLATVLLWCGLLFAEGNPRSRLQENIKKWNSLSPAQKEILRERFKKWKNLSNEEKGKLRQRLELLNALPRPQRAKIQQRLKQLKSLTPHQRRILQQKAKMWRALRRHLLDSLGKQERERLENLPPMERRQELKKMLGRHIHRKCKEFVKRFLPTEQKKRLLNLPQERFVRRVRPVMRHFLQKRQEFLKGLPPDEREAFRVLPPVEQHKKVIIFIQQHKGEKSGKERSGKPPRLRKGADRVKKVHIHQPAFVGELLTYIKRLPPRQKREFIHSLKAEEVPTRQEVPEKVRKLVAEFKKLPQEEREKILKRLLHPVQQKPAEESKHARPSGNRPRRPQRKRE